MAPPPGSPGPVAAASVTLAGDLADAAREYREHARRERRRVEEQRNKRWSLFGGRK